MLFTIRIYYDERNKVEYNKFYNEILGKYLEQNFSLYNHENSI